MKTSIVEQCHLLSKARDFTTCLFHPHLFVVGVFWLCIWHPENEKQRLITKENWNPSSVLALLQGTYGLQLKKGELNTTLPA